MLINAFSEDVHAFSDLDPTVLDVKEEDQVALLPDACAIIAFDKKVFALCETLGVYSLEIISANSDEINSSQQQKSSRDVRFHDGRTNNEARALHSNKLPVQLYILIPFSYKSLEPDDDLLGTLRISDSLYNCLFGRNLNMSNAPILLIVQPGGVVLWLPLSGYFDDSCDSGERKSNRPSVLCDLEQDVVGLFALSSKNVAANSIHYDNKPLRSLSVLVLVGHRGSVLAISCETVNAGLTTTYKRHLIPGPIISCDVSSLDLFCCSELDLLHVDLSQLLSDTGNHISSRLKTKSHGISDIVALSVTQAPDSKVGEVVLLTVTSQGRLKRCILVLDTSSSSVLNKNDPGQMISSQLVGIHQLSKEYSKLCDNSQKLDEALSQLALASVIQSTGHRLQWISQNTKSCGYKNAELLDDECSPVHCASDVRLAHSRIFITVSLQNNSNFSFGSGWTFHVYVSEHSDMPIPELLSERIALHPGCSCSIDGLSPGRLKSMSIEFSYSRPFVILPSLILDVGSLVPSNTNLEPLVVALQPQIFNELKLLRPLTHGSLRAVDCPEQTMPAILQTLANQHSANFAERKDKFLECQTQDYHVDVCIPDYSMREILPPDFSGVISNDKGKDFQQLLTILLSDNPFFRGMSFENTVVRAVSCCGHSVSIDVQLSSSCNNGNCFVSLHSSSIALIAQLRIDMESRLKMLSSSYRTIPACGSGRKLAKLNRIEELLVQFANGSTMDFSTYAKVFSLYQSVRSTNL